MARYREEARVVIDADGREYLKTVKKMRNVTRQEVQAMKRSFMGLGVIAAGLGYLTKGAAEFEQELARVQKVTKFSAAEMDAMAVSIRKMAKDTIYSTSQLNEIARAAGQLGIGAGGARKDLEEFTRVVALMGTATVLSGEQAAFALARINSLTGTAYRDTERVASSIVALGNTMAANEDSIAHSAQEIAAAIGHFGATAADVNALGAAVAHMGQDGAKSATAVGKAVGLMNAAVLRGGKELQQFSEIAGVSSEEFRMAFENNVVDALNMFIIGLNKSGASAQFLLENVGLNDMRTNRVLLALAKNQQHLTTALNTSRTAYERNIAVQKEYDLATDTLSAQTKILTNRIKDLGLEIGTQLVPIVRGAVDSLNSFFSDDNSKRLVIIIGQVVKWTAALLAARIALAALVIGGNALRAAFMAGAWLRTVIASTYGLVTAQGALAAGLHASTLATKLGTIAWRAFWGAATLGLAVLIGYLIPKMVAWFQDTEGKLDYMSAKWNMFWSNVKIATLGTLKVMIAAFGGFVAAIVDAVTWAISAIPFVDIQTDLLGMVSQGVQAMDDLMEGHRDNIHKFKMDAADAFGEYKKSVIDAKNASNQFGMELDDLNKKGREVAQTFQSSTDFSTYLEDLNRLGRNVNRKPGASTEDPTSEAEEDPFAWLNRSGVRGGRGRAEGQWEAARRQTQADQLSAGLGPSVAGGRGSARGQDEAAFALAKAENDERNKLLQEQADAENRIHEHKLETQKMLEEMYRTGRKDRDIQEYEEDQALKLSRMEAELIEDQMAKDLELARLESHEEKLQRIRDKADKEEREKEKKRQLESLSFLAQRYSGAARILSAYNKWQALQALSQLPGQAAASAAETAKAAPWPANIPLVAGAIAQVLAQAVAIKETLTGGPAIPAMNAGGIVPGGGYGNFDRQMVYATPGELMVPKNDINTFKEGVRQEMLSDMGERGGRAVDVNLTMDKNLGRFVQAEFDSAEETWA